LRGFQPDGRLVIVTDDGIRIENVTTKPAWIPVISLARAPLPGLSPCPGADPQALIVACNDCSELRNTGALDRRATSPSIWSGTRRVTLGRQTGRSDDEIPHNYAPLDQDHHCPRRRVGQSAHPGFRFRPGLTCGSARPARRAAGDGLRPEDHLANHRCAAGSPCDGPAIDELIDRIQAIWPAVW